MSILTTALVLILTVWAFMTLTALLARYWQRTDVVDSAWGLGFVLVAWTAWTLDNRHIGLRMLAAELVTLWGLRLFVHITGRNLKKTEDYRYVAYRKKWGKSYWMQAYFRIFLLQGALVLIISTPIIAIMHAPEASIHWLAIAGCIIWAAAIVFEAEADAELVKFVKTKKPGEIMTKGLWRYSRHPNYFGEITVWWGAAIVALSLRQWWGIIGALVITLLITKVSGLPPLEKRYAKDKAFQEYKKHTSVLVPLPRR